MNIVGRDDALAASTEANYKNSYRSRARDGYYNHKKLIIKYKSVSVANKYSPSSFENIIK